MLGMTLMLLAGTLWATGRCDASAQVEGFGIARGGGVRIATRTISDNAVVRQSIAGNRAILYARMNEDHGGMREFPDLLPSKRNVHRRLIKSIGLVATQGTVEIWSSVCRTLSELLSCLTNW